MTHPNVAKEYHPTKNEISIENIDINNLTDISISDKAKVLIYNDNNGNRKLLKSIY